MGRKLLEGWGETDDMVCDRDSSFECDTSILSCKGCNVGRLVWKDLFQIAGLRGRRPYMWEVSLGKKMHFWGKRLWT